MVELICLFGGCEHAFVVNVWLGGLTAVAAMAAVGIAWYELASARRSEAVRATYAVIEQEAGSELERVHLFADFVREHDRDPAKIAEAMSGDRFVGQSVGVQAAFALLNRREYVGALLRFKGGDLQSYLRWNHGLVEEWDALSVYVQRLRAQEDSPELYCDFEWLAQHSRVHLEKSRHD